jgi:glyoxylase-like metal-dependent hydrolase (beta-lactamase superfamily II)
MFRSMVERRGPQRFAVGSIECWVVPDGIATYRPAFWLADIDDDERQRALEGRLDAHGFLPVPYNCLLVRSGGRTALLDTGAGTELAAEWEEPVGGLQESLRRIGIEPEGVDVVLVSHGHADHIGGLTTPPPEVRRPMFPRARHWFWSTEWDAWTTEQGLAQFSEALGKAARVHLPVIEQAGLVELADEETDVLPGVRLLPAPGHTPGHMAVVLTSGREGAIYLGDAVTDQLSFERPDWLTAAEAIPALSLATRKRLLKRAVQERLTVAAFHLSGVGRVERATDPGRFTWNA